MAAKRQLRVHGDLRSMENIAMKKALHPVGLGLRVFAVAFRAGNSCADACPDYEELVRRRVLIAGVGAVDNGVDLQRHFR